MVLLVFFVSLIILLFLRAPVALALLGINILAVIYFYRLVPGFRVMLLSVFSSLSSFTLVPIPLFVLMGEFMFRTGVAGRALMVLDQWLGRVPGRLAVLATVGGTIFAALSGSTMGNTAMLGTVLLPQMIEQGYDRRLAAGSIMASGGLAMIIPPSALAVLYGAIANIPIGPLLIAGVIPGIIMGLNYTALVVGRCLVNPRLAPSYPVQKITWKQRMDTLVKDILPLGWIMILVTGLMFVGVATPTEAAALGTVGAVILALAYRRMSWKIAKDCLASTVRITGMIFFIYMASQLYSQVMSFSGASSGGVRAMLSLDVPSWVVLLLMMVVVLILGMFLDQVAIMMVTIPFFTPVAQQLGWDPLWFGILMLINLQIALTTPPFGLLLFVMKGVAPKDFTMKDIIMSGLPFLICDTISFLIVAFVPATATWLPGLMSR